MSAWALSFDDHHTAPAVVADHRTVHTPRGSAPQPRQPLVCRCGVDALRPGRRVGTGCQRAVVVGRHRRLIGHHAGLGRPRPAQHGGHWHHRRAARWRASDHADVGTGRFVDSGGGRAPGLAALGVAAGGLGHPPADGSPRDGQRPTPHHTVRRRPCVAASATSAVGWQLGDWSIELHRPHNGRRQWYGFFSHRHRRALWV